MASRTNIAQTNNIVYVEPNYAYSIEGYNTGGLENFEFIPNTEDYSIYVNLEIETIGRTIQTGNRVFRFTYTSKGGDESVNLMGGSKIYTTDGNSINSLTTNYTNYHITDINGVGASPELFGINYIDIAYNHFMVPEVTIEFVDVRGASVFGQREAFETNNAERAIRGNYKDDVVNTFFQCFFTFPYPKFTLVVKGFYGDPVSYELTCADFRARFNSDTGNFSCTAKFVGYYFSFLNDAMLNALIAAPFSDFLGAEYWKQQAFKLKGINGGEVDLPTLGYLLKVMKNAEAAAEQISQSSPEVQEKTNVEQLSEAYSTIKRLYQTYVKAIADLVKTKTLDDGIELFISDMTDNNISSAAIILVPKTAENETFEAHFSENGTTPVTNAYNALTGQISSFTSEYTSISFPTLNNFASASTKQRIFQVDGDTTKCIVDSNHVNDDIKNRSRNLYNAFEKKVLNQNKDNETNKYVQTMWAYFYDDNGFMDSLDAAMKKLSDREKELTKAIASSKADALAKRLGFKPSVENVTRILMAHFQTFAYMIFKTARMIDAEDPKRDTKKLGITDDDDIADVPEKYRSAEGYLLVPPFPNVTKLVEKNGIKNREESWVGEYGNKFKETDLVHGILNGIEEFVKLVSAGENAGSAGSTSSVNAVMSHPLSPLDLVLTKNIYAEFDQNEVSSLLSLVGLRALQILGLTNFDNWDKNCEVLGAAEAENLLKTEKLSNDLKNLLNNLKDNVDPIIEMLKGNPTSDIQKPSSGVWPWQESTESVGIIGNDGEFNICKADGVKGSTTYCLPIQGLDWNKIKREVIHSKSAYASDDYFNISQTLIENSYKDNIFNIETNINRVKNICERQLETPDGIEDYKENFLKEATYNSDKYDDFFKHESDLIAYPIDGADKLLPSNNSKMIPCTINYIKQMSWGGGYGMNDFHKFNPSSDWKDKDGNEVKRKGEDGYKDFFKDIDTNKYTLTEIPGLKYNLEPTNDTSLFTEKLYYLQNDDRVKGFMLLCSLGYLYKYDEIFQDELCDIDKTISIIPLPAVIFAGAILWLIEDKSKNKKLFKGCDPIPPSDSDNDTTIKKCIKQLQKLDPQIQLKLKKAFNKWINEGVMNNDIIVSFKEVKNNLELKLLRLNETVKISDTNVETITYETFFNSLGEMEDESWFFGKKRTWFKEGIFSPKGYKNILELFAGEFGENFFRNYICVDEDLKGSSNTIGMRVGNRDGSVGIKQYVDFALAPCLFMKNSKFFLKDTPKVLKVETGNLKSFFKGFLNRICEEETQETEDNSVSQAREPQTTDDIKVGVYRYCKLLYDKWIGGISDTDFEQYTMKEFFDNDTKYFHFIDAYYNYANELTINIGRFCDMVKESYANADYSLLSFMSSVYSENKFSFHCIQNFLDLSRRENMMRMFDLVPYTEIKWDKIKKHPNFVVNYAYEASSHLDIEGDEYENDSFMVNQAEGIGNKWPEALKSRHAGETKGLNVPAFGVSYGKMYQSYFKDVSISMDNPTVTEQSIKAQFAIACQNNEKTSQPDESKQYTYGQDLYSVYSNNSYECDVTMMGCAWVQPLMLFVLNNVPMFRGTYQIINVTHHIEQGDMTTKFKGVRMANVTTRIVENNCVSSTSDQTDAGVNTEINQESAYASDDNDCAYAEYPIVSNGDVAITVSNDENYTASQIMTKIMARGYTKEQAAGIVGNMAVESPGFNASNVICDCNKQGACYYSGGICMWHNQGLTALRNLDPANVNNTKYTGIACQGFGKHNKEMEKTMPSADQQVTFLLDSLEQDNYLKKSRKVKEHLMTAKTPEQAAFYFARDFENCGDCQKENSKTVTSRKEKARFFYDNFQNLSAPPVVNNGDEKVSELANGFLHALNQTSTSSAVGVEIGIDKEKSNGDTIYLTNAKDSQNFGKVLDMMLQAYSSKIEEIRWLVPGENGNQSLPPAAYIVTLKEGSTYTLVKVVNESNNELVSEISMENEGGINTDFRKAIVKKYKDETNKVEKVGKYVLPAMSKETIEKLFNENEIKNCNSVRSNEAPSTASSNTPIEGPATTSNWDVNAFVKNLHYYQDTICENREGEHKDRKPTASWNLPNMFGNTKNGCGWCTSVVNRALRDVGFGRKYWGDEPWIVYEKMKKPDSDFMEIESNEVSNKNRAFPTTINPLAGDICVMWGKPQKRPHRHTCAFDGQHWVSDIVQKQANVYGSSPAFTLEYHVFRHK